MRLEKLSDNFIEKFVEIAAGNIPSADFEVLLTLIENEAKQTFFTQTSESNLLRIFNGMIDKAFFLNECIKFPHYVEILICVSSNSNYLSDILVLNPEFFYLVVDPSRLSLKLNGNMLNKELNNRISLYSSLNAKVNAINNIKRKEILRTGLKDIFLKNDLPEITRELSILASSLTAKLFSICYEYTLNKYKIESDKGSFCIVALGKLGGSELNYSSDIDLMVFYDSESKIKNRYYSEILSEAIQLFLEKAATSESGLLYRIDLRLRPDGKSSPVCRSLQEYLDYYETRGDDWERQMLIKAAFLTGDKKLYKRFINYLDSFVYPPTIFSSPIEQMNKLKKISENKAAGAENIKFDPGGIRTIEFIVQGLQLLNSGRNDSLKTGNTLNAIERLKKANLLSDEESELLVSAYTFYRNIEHYLQLMNNKQTHIIPESGEIAEKLSHFLKFKKIHNFRQKVEGYRKQVRNFYKSILDTSLSKSASEPDLSIVHFQNPQKAFNDFRFLKEGRGLTISSKFDIQTVESFRKIEPQLFELLLKSEDPDSALSNFVRIIKNADFPSIWYNELADKDFFRALIKLCDHSQKSVELFAEDKELRETLLSRKIFREIDGKTMVGYKLKEVLLLLSSRVTLNLVTAREASILLSYVVREKIKKMVSYFVESKKWKEDFFIAVLGSTGTDSMSFGSDIDLIFAGRDIQKYKKSEQNFQDLLKLIRENLFPLSVDCRLRPEGRSSQLVWDLEGYKNYFQNRARIWELQSFLKAKLIFGSKKLYNSLVNSYLKRIDNLSKTELVNGINEIRKKALSSFPPEVQLIDLRRNPGGLNDIEYTAHYLLLSTKANIKNSMGKPVMAILSELSRSKKGLISLKALENNHIFLKELEIFNQIITNGRTSKMSEEPSRLSKLALLLNFKSGHELQKKIRSVLNENRDFYLKIIS